MDGIAIKIIVKIKYLKSGPTINFPQQTLLSPILSTIQSELLKIWTLDKTN